MVPPRPSLRKVLGFSPVAWTGFALWRQKPHLMTSPSGILVLDKPAGITSRDAVDEACRRLKTREIGHCGTLDPLAKGVLVLVLGRARRLQELLSRSLKVYEARVRLGASSETDDAEGPLHPCEGELSPPSQEVVERVVAGFHGEIEQRPPAYSAVKVEGKRLYAMARKGEKVEAPMRTVRVFEIEVLRYEWPNVDLRIGCAGGTYVRSIARDIGEALGTRGYLRDLVRVGSGGFNQEVAVAPEVVELKDVLPLEDALRDFPSVHIAAMQARRLANGAEVRAELPNLGLDEETHLFGWVHGRAVAMLKKVGPSKVRSARLLVSPERLLELAEEELRAEDLDAQSRTRPATRYED